MVFPHNVNCDFKYFSMRNKLKKGHMFTMAENPSEKKFPKFFPILKGH